MRRWIVGGLAGAVVLGLAGLICLWAMFQYIPSWYQPAEIPIEHRQAIRDDYLLFGTALHDQLNQSSAPYTLRITEQQINAWLMIRETIWPASSRWLPRELSDPQIKIDPRGVRLAVTARHRGVRTVLNAQLEIRLADDAIRVRLAEVAGGALPVPKGVLREQLAGVSARDWPVGERIEGQLDDYRVPAAEKFLDGIELPTGWIWPFGERPFRITGLALEKGAIVFTVSPVPRR